jgi:hypothetical protein
MSVMTCAGQSRWTIRWRYNTLFTITAASKPIMRLLSVALLIQSIVALPDSPAPPTPSGECATSAYYKPKPYGYFINNTIYTPIGNESITYPRHVELQDGTILATGSLRGRRSPAALPIFESKDGGASWRWVSDVADQVNGWGLGGQAALAEL